MHQPTAFNPLDKVNLGQNVAYALNQCAPVILEKLPRFKGAGIYALYYLGRFEPYVTFSDLNRANPCVPIYVGKAIPEGGRKGLEDKKSEVSNSLCGRLRQHASSIAATRDLGAADFVCRYLVIEDTWIGLCESLLIQRERPLWNVMLAGFGRNVGGINRKDGLSDWHAFHGGRDVDPSIPTPDERIQKLRAEVASYLTVMRDSRKIVGNVVCR